MPTSTDLIYAPYTVDFQGVIYFFVNFFSSNSVTSDIVYGYIVSAWWIYSLVAFVCSGVLLFAIVYTKMRLHELEHIVAHNIQHVEEHVAHQHAHASKNQRWQDVEHHTESDNPNDWRSAIIEADIMLEDVLNKLGYSGITIGDKLKQASPQFFRSIEDAWKAHRVRNDIAHRGSDFILTKRLAKETIEQYRRVFQEFEVI